MDPRLLSIDSRGSRRRGCCMYSFKLVQYVCLIEIKEGRTWMTKCRNCDTAMVVAFKFSSVSVSEWSSKDSRMLCKSSFVWSRRIPIPRSAIPLQNESVQNPLKTNKAHGLRIHQDEFASSSKPSSHNSSAHISSNSSAKEISSSKVRGHAQFKMDWGFFVR